MTDEEQKAWDMFAAAALAEAMRQVYVEYGKWCGATWEARYYEAANLSASQADAMMEQRKARWGDA